MKPLGMSMDLRVIKPTHAEDKVWDAVEEAQSEGWTVERFIREAREAWANGLREKAKADDKAFV